VVLSQSALIIYIMPITKNQGKFSMNAQKHIIYFRPLRFTLVLFIAAALILMPGVSLAAENITPETVLLQRINQERAQAGLPAYRLNAALCQAASIKCMDMVREGYFAHESPTLGNISDQLQSMGLSVYCAENIAQYSSLDKAHAALMSSQGHRRNILAKNFNNVGIAVFQDAYGFVTVVEVFAKL
jgi:uncharacterized protein YkwD